MALTAGILVDTLFGPKPVEDLRPGDPLLAGSAGLKTVGGTRRARLSAVTLNAAQHKPILIRRNAFGRGKPARDMLVSPGQRLLLPELGAATAQSLTDGRRIMRVSARKPVLFVEVQLEGGGEIAANGVPMLAKALPALPKALEPRMVYPALPASGRPPLPI